MLNNCGRLIFAKNLGNLPFLVWLYSWKVTWLSYTWKGCKLMFKLKSLQSRWIAKLLVTLTICAGLTVRLSPHQHERKFSCAHVCRQRHLQTSTPTPQKSFPKFWNVWKYPHLSTHSIVHSVVDGVIYEFWNFAYDLWLMTYEGLVEMFKGDFEYTWAE